MSNFNIASSLHKHGIISDAEMGEHISKALDDDDNFEVRSSAIRHPNATSTHIDKALNDEEGYIRHEAISHQNVTSNHINKALGDENWYVQEAAQRIKKERNL
jgi:hypothetical protein